MRSIAGLERRIAQAIGADGSRIAQAIGDR